MSAAPQYFCMNPIQSRWITTRLKQHPRNTTNTLVGVFCFFGKISRLKECYSKRWFSISGALCSRWMVYHRSIKAALVALVRLNLQIVFQHPLTSIKRVTSRKDITGQKLSGLDLLRLLTLSLVVVQNWSMQ